MKSHRVFYPLLCFLFILALARPAMSQSNEDCTNNESWANVGAGLPGPAFASTEMDGNLYVLHRSDPDDSSRFQISIWDGSVWTVATSFKLDFLQPAVNRFYIGAFQGYKGSIYMSGRQIEVNDDSALTGIVRWDGSAWSFAGDIPGTPGIFYATAFGMHNGNLIASALIPESPTSGWRIVQFDGTAWSYVGGKEAQKNNPVWAQTFLSWNGDLYVGGNLFIMNDVEMPMAARWDGATWSPVGTGPRGRIDEFFVLNNQLYATGPMWMLNPDGRKGENLARWDGHAWTVTDVPQPNRSFLNNSLVMHGHQIYAATYPDSDIVRKGDAPHRTIERFDGAAWHIVPSFDGSIHFLASYSGNLYAGGYLSSSCGTPLSNIAMFYGDEDYGKVTGNIFHDANANCVQDADDKGLARRIVTILPGPYYAATSKQGDYSCYLPNGNYTVAFQQPGHWNRICPADPGTYDVAISSTSDATDIDFSAQPIPGIQDLRVSIMAGHARQGRQLVYLITYENAGNVTMNGTVRFSHDAILTFDSATTAPSRYTPNLAEWDFTNLEMEESRTITVYTTVPVATPFGTNICSQLDILPATSTFGTDDRDSVCTQIGGSYDPNDISVTPFGIENNGVISPKDRTLTYRVRFQNTGNDTAFKVVVTDKLSPNLDISSIRLGAASHPFSFSIDKGNLLTWTFDNILLPDSAANQTNSNGFFKFSVDMKPGIAAGTQIANFADIYFDYNVPVRTNTVVSIIGAASGVDAPADVLSSLAIYPNPARSMLHLDGKLRSGAVVKLRNLLGQEVARYTHDGTGRMTIDASALPAGTYLLEAEMTDGTIMQRVTVMK